MSRRNKLSEQVTQWTYWNFNVHRLFRTVQTPLHWTAILLAPENAPESFLHACFYRIKKMGRYLPFVLSECNTMRITHADTGDRPCLSIDLQGCLHNFSLCLQFCRHIRCIQYGRSHINTNLAHWKLWLKPTPEKTSQVPWTTSKCLYLFINPCQQLLHVSDWCKSCR